MAKQKNMLLEIIVLVFVIGGLCFLLWNVNFYTTPKSNTAAASTDKLISATDQTIQTADWQEGKLLYRSYCNSCHMPLQNSLGPVLSGATERWHTAGSYKGKSGDEWLKVWIRNWKEVVDAGYPYGVAMAKSREAEMNMFTNLTDKQIDMILLYADAPMPNTAK